MDYRIIFPAVRRVSSLDDFFDYVRRLVAETSSKKGSANFFLFGECLLGPWWSFILVYFRFVFTHAQVRDFISKLQGVIGPKDFIIFSIYTKINSSLLNAAYLVGKNQVYFDFKRDPAPADTFLLWSKCADWKSMSVLNVKSPGCVRAGGALIRNLHLVVCSDIDLLPKMHFEENSLVFVPAYRLPPENIRYWSQNLNGSGRIFINDPANRSVWHIQFNRVSPTKVNQTYFEKKKYVYLDFEM